MFNSTSESWVEKYRPNTLTKVTSQQNVINSLKNVAKEKHSTFNIFWSIWLW